MLFSLTCPERVSALTKLDLRHCRVLPEGVEFTLSGPHKRGSTDQLLKAFFACFPSNSKLCQVESLRSYLKATRTIRAPILQGGSIVYLLCETSQADYSHVSREVATYATEGLWCKHQYFQGTFCTRSLNHCSSQFQRSIIRDFKNG